MDQKVLDFAEEFTRLLIRYTKTPSPNSNSSDNALKPLTNQDVMKAVHNVLYTILGINVTKDDNFLVKTPTNGIAVNTPTAPIVFKINPEQNDENASINAQSKVTDSSSSFNSPMLTNVEDTNNSIEVMQEGEKSSSQSVPAIYVSNIGRSDTFTREKKTKINDQDDVFTKFGILSPGRTTFFQSLDELRAAAMTFVAKIDKMKKRMVPQPAEHNRRLSSNGFSGLTRSSTMMSKTMLPIKIRRSITTFPGTPTSSRSLTLAKDDSFDRRKSMSAVSSNIATSRKVSEFTTVGRSVPNLTCNKSPNSIKPVKNVKYAHIQSTIPKSTNNIVKKKV